MFGVPARSKRSAGVADGSARPERWPCGTTSPRSGAWTVDDADGVLHERFATRVRAPAITVGRVAATSAALRMPFAGALCRDDGAVGGHALAAPADTAMVIVVAAAPGGWRPMATVDPHTTCSRPRVRVVPNADVVVEARVARIGRTPAFARVAMRAPPRDASRGSDPRAVVASAVGAFAVP